MKTLSKGMRVALFTALAVIGSGCATMSADECRVADWYRIGEQDARAGRNADFLATRSRNCNDAGFPADTSAWYAGFEFGLGFFCTLDNGFRFGLDGNRYQRSCPADLEPAFIEGYELGLPLHGAMSRVSSLQTRLNELNRDIRRQERAEVPDREAILALREERVDLLEELRVEEVALADLRAMAQSRGFVVPR